MRVVFCFILLSFFFKLKTAYEMRISDWSSDVCSSDLMSDAHGIGNLVVSRVVACRSMVGSIAFEHGVNLLADAMWLARAARDSHQVGGEFAKPPTKPLQGIIAGYLCV